MKKALAKLSTLATLAYISIPTVFAQTMPDNGGGAGSNIGNSIEGELEVRKLGPAGVTSLGRLISAAFGVAVLLAVIFVFMQLIQGGYAWITAGGDKSKVEEARTRITNALIGLAIVAAAWAIIVVVGQFFGVTITDIRLPSATGTNTTGGQDGGL